MDTASAATLDMRRLDAHQGPPQVLATFDGLKAGTAMDVIDDHEPKAVFDQFQAERYGQFSWRLLEQGPDTWRVRIGRTGGRCCGQCG